MFKNPAISFNVTKTAQLYGLVVFIDKFLVGAETYLVTYN